MENNQDLNNLSEVVSDLNLLLDTAPETSEQPQKLQEITNNINLLDKEEKIEGNLRNPGEVLKDYSNLEKEKMKAQVELDDFKQKHLEIFEEYQAILDKITEASSKQEELKPELTKSMEDSGLKNIADDMFKVTFVAATTRENFDKKGFEKKYPVIYKQFLQKSEVSAYVKISNNNK